MINLATLDDAGADADDDADAYADDGNDIDLCFQFGNLFLQRFYFVHKDHLNLTVLYL